MIDYNRYTAMSFDCYGTLIDWESGITAWADAWIEDTGVPLSACQVLTGFARHERQVQAQAPEMRYPDVLAEVIRRIGGDHRIEITSDTAQSFAASVGDWPAFTDSTAALRALSERFKLIILSNVDRSSFARSQERLKVKFDAIITAEDVGSYKPDTQNFDTLLATADGIGVPKHALLHVGESLYHDIAPANRDGIDCVWIDRKHNAQGPRVSGSVAGETNPLAVYDSMYAFAKAALNGGFV